MVSSNRPIKLFILFSIISLLGIFNVINFDQYSVVYLRLITALFAFIIAFNLTKDVKNIKVIALAISLGTLAGIAYSYTLGSAGMTNNGRMFGIYDNPNTFGVISVAGIVFSLMYGLLINRRITYILISIFILIFLLAILASASRKSALAAVVLLVSLAYSFLKSRQRILLISMITFVWLISLLANYSIGLDSVLGGTVLGDRVDGEYIEHSYDHRTKLLGYAWSAFNENFFFGVGWGNFVNHNPYHQYTHTDFMEVIVATGITGTLIYFGFLGSILQQFIRVRSANLDQNQKSPKALIINLAIAFYIVFIMLGFGKPNFSDIFYMSYLGFFVGSFEHHFKGGKI
jgi:O-antigen ligase